MNFVPGSQQPSTPEIGSRAFLIPESDIAFPVTLTPAQRSEYHATAIGRALSAGSLANVWEACAAMDLKFERVRQPGIVYVEGEVIAKRTDYGRLNREVRRAKAVRRRPDELIELKASELLANGAFSESSTETVTTTNIDLGMRCGKNRLGWIILNVSKPVPTTENGADLILSEMLATVDALAPQQKKSLEAQKAKFVKKNKPFAFRVPIASVRMSTLTERASQNGKSTEGFLRFLAQKNQPTMTQASFEQVGVVGSQAGILT